MTSEPPDDQLRRWRLILGHHAEADLQGMGNCPLGSDDIAMDDALAAIYDESDGEDGDSRRGGLGGSAPRLAKWLGDVRHYFQEDVVAVIQQDAIERKGLTQLLFEPEVLGQVEPNVQLVGTLMALRGQIPERTKETAREVVRAVVDKIKLLLESKLRQAVMGALNRRQHSPIPNVSSTDWHTTIRRNLKNWDPQCTECLGQPLIVTGDAAVAQGQQGHAADPAAGQMLHASDQLGLVTAFVQIGDQSATMPDHRRPGPQPRNAPDRVSGEWLGSQRRVHHAGYYPSLPAPLW